MPMKLTHQKKQLLLAEAANFSTEEKEFLLRMVEAGSYAEDAAKVSYDSSLRPFIDQWVEKVKYKKGYRAQMWIVRKLAGTVQKLFNDAFGQRPVTIMNEYMDALEKLRPRFQAAKQKVDSDPQAAVNEIIDMFDDFHNTKDGYFARLNALWPAGYLNYVMTLFNPVYHILGGAASAAGWAAYKRLMNKAIQEATKLQRGYEGTPHATPTTN